MDARRLLTELWRAALSAVDPESLVAGYLRTRRIAPTGRVGVFASGKAAAGMCAGVPRELLNEGLLVVPCGTPVPRRLLRFARFAAHPDPDRSSLAAAKEAVDFFRGFGKLDMILALISGGSSSLLCLPSNGETLASKRAKVRRAGKEGWTIERINRLRSSLSLVKDGRLAEATPARVLTLILSDVPGSDFRIVGSGPTVSRRKAGDRAVLLADNRTGLAAAANFARSRGVPVRVERRRLSGEAAAAGEKFALRLRSLGRGVLLAGGETTVRHTGRSGSGGRSQELALGAARVLAAGEAGQLVLSAGSDGIDGNSENAGAFSDRATLPRARELGLDPEQFLRRHDSATFFESLGDQFRPGATGSNVADWVFGISGRG
ncbi:MAG: glycerate kinase type-2 family protein [Thermoanaerobaculia bacterium]